VHFPLCLVHSTSSFSYSHWFFLKYPLLFIKEIQRKKIWFHQLKQTLPLEINQSLLKKPNLKIINPYVSNTKVNWHTLSRKYQIPNLFLKISNVLVKTPFINNPYFLVLQWIYCNLSMEWILLFNNIISRHVLVYLYIEYQWLNRLCQQYSMRKHGQYIVIYRQTRTQTESSFIHIDTVHFDILAIVDLYTKA
jgi:hypothetical protein